METTEKTTEKKVTVLDKLQEMPEKVWSEFKQFSLFKKAILVGCIYFVINNLTKNLSLKQEDLTDNILELPKKIWANFWTAPTGKKFLLVLAAWYTVKQLFPKEATVTENKA